MVDQQGQKVLHVAVGVIMRQGQVLISWRNAGQHQGNRYEFPGGKIDAHETPQQGLCRELQEELGIDVQHVVRAQQLYFQYPEKTVCLHIFKVTAFSGEPAGREGQPIRWVDIADLPQYRFPDANAPILRMVHLPEHYVISAELEAGQTLQEWLAWHVKHVPHNAWLYVRLPQSTAEIYCEVLKQLHKQRPDLKLIAMFKHLAGLSDGILAKLKGMHLTQQDLMQCNSLADYPAALYKMAACHDKPSIEQANRLQLDAITLSPLHATQSHKGLEGLGLENWQGLCELSFVPVYALGGVQLDELQQIQACGGFGIAGIRAFYT